MLSSNRAIQSDKGHHIGTKQLPRRHCFKTTWYTHTSTGCQPDPYTLSKQTFTFKKHDVTEHEHINLWQFQVPPWVQPTNTRVHTFMHILDHRVTHCLFSHNITQRPDLAASMVRSSQLEVHKLDCKHFKT